MATAVEQPSEPAAEPGLPPPEPPVPRLSGGDRLEALFGGLDFGAELCSLLWARKVRSVADLVHLPAWELRDWLLAPEADALAIIARAHEACAARAVSAWDLAQAAAGRGEGMRVPPPLPSLGAAFGGEEGLAGLFMEVAGPPGAGKTQFCLHLASQTALQGGEVFWLDTESTFAPARVFDLLETMVREDPQRSGVADVEEHALAALQRIRCHQCSTLQALLDVAAELEVGVRRGGLAPALVVVDSVAAAARNCSDAAGDRRAYIPQRQAALSALASHFKALVTRRASRDAPEASAGTARCPAVVVTNQVMGDPGSGGSRVALGHVWHHAVGSRVVLSHLPPGDPRGLGTREVGMGGRRYLHVEKSPSAPALVVPFEIGRPGLVEAGSAYVY
eukprot:TRINITY_DN26584_c0_g1_i1.p1 TRINITY_DN26584_c0_g1~~TRINITY_DN26584_c0_g1_i1.p1  ORF type:complete len:392 (-),score=64.66 TRINITY_DN26584_c0_g1_i1:70-1245(-)